MIRARDLTLLALACACAVQATSVMAQFVCEPQPKRAQIIFQLGQSALSAAQRAEIASTLGEALPTSAIHLHIDPRTSVLEASGLGNERLALAKQRGDYITDFLAKAGVDRANISTDLNYSLSFNRFDDHAEDRTTYVETYIFNGEVVRKCTNRGLNIVR